MGVTRKEIAGSLQALGLKNGDVVLLHSSLLSIGKVEGGPAAVIDAFLDVLGSEGTLLVPVFGALGVLTEEVKSRPEAVISSAPVGTLAAIGRDAEAICRDHWKAETAHGKDTPFTRIAERDGYICMLGCDHDRNTSLHSVEALLELPYLCETERTFTNPDGEEVTKTYKYYPGPHRDFIGLGPLLEDVTIHGRIGNAEVRLVKARGMFEKALAAGKADPAFVLCDNPECADCVSQRAAIARDRMEKRESFQLAAGSRLAGRYVPEMIENLRRTGITLLELDYIQGKPWHMWNAEQLTCWREEFARGGITICGARCISVPDDSAKLIEAANAIGIKRLLLPLNDSNSAVLAALAAGIEVVYFNVNQSGTRAAEKLLRHRTAAQREFGFAFNPVNFAVAGEKPFLQSYRRGRFLKTMTQLDVTDCTREGDFRALAQGVAEIKELISIVRCRNFSGYMVLGGGGYPADLEALAADFTWLLDNM